MNREHIETLIEKYLDGRTTDAEERELRTFFARPASSSSPEEGEQCGGEMPEEWRVYRALFAFEESEAGSIGNPPSAKRLSPFRGAGWGFLLTAASLAALIAVAATLLPLPHRQQDYAVIDGKVYTDRETVMREAEEAMMLVSSSEEETFDALLMMQ